MIMSIRRKPRIRTPHRPPRKAFSASSAARFSFAPCTVTKDAPKAAQDFVDFLKGEQGQKAYAETGYRPLVPIDGLTVKGANDESNPFPEPATLQTIDKDFGGWDSANTKFFDENDGILTKIQAEAGK